MINVDKNRLETIDVKTFAEKFRGMISKLNEYNLPYHIMIVNVIAGLIMYRAADIKVLINLFKKSLKNEPKSKDLLFSLAYCKYIECTYCTSKLIFIRRKNYLYVSDSLWPFKELKETINLLKKITIKESTSFVYVLLTTCHGLLVGYDKVKTKFKKISNAQFHKDERSIVNQIIQMGTTLSRLRSMNLYYKDGKYDKILYVCKKDGNKDISYLLQQEFNTACLFYSYFLFTAYAYNMKFDKAQVYLEKSIRIANNLPELYEAAGWTYAMTGNYNIAVQHFKKALGFYRQSNRTSVESQLGNEFSQGMMAWQEWAIKGKGLVKVYEHFEKSAELSQSTKQNNNYPPFAILPYLVRLDEQIKTLSLSYDLYDLRIRVIHLLDEIYKLGREYKLFGKSTSDFVLLDIPPVIDMFTMFHIKYFYLIYLFLSLVREGFKGSITIDTKHQSRLIFFNRCMFEYEFFLSKQNFTDVVKAFQNLRSFRKAIGNRYLEDITEYESKALINTLNQYWGNIGSVLSIANIIKYTQQIPNLERKVAVIEKRTKRMTEWIEEIPLFINTTINEVKRKIEDLEKKVIISEDNVFFEKPPIITMDGIRPFDELAILENTKQLFHIWIDQRKPEVIVNGVIQEKMAESLQARRLLILLLFKHDNLVTHKEIFEALDEERRKLDSGNIRASIQSFKSNVNQMICNLNERTNGLFENNIVTLKRQGYRFDLQGMKFCIINKQI